MPLQQGDSEPAIQLIFPVTESLSAGGQDTYPGILVSLNESWYSQETASMAEFLDSEIVQVGQPDNPDITVESGRCETCPGACSKPRCTSKCIG